MPIKEDLSAIQTLNRRKHSIPADTILGWHPKNEMMIALLSEKFYTMVKKMKFLRVLQ